MTPINKASQLFKEIRLERGLTLTDVAGDLSISTVSKFENGHSEISAEKLMMLLQKLGMDAIEFFEILDQSQATDTNPVILSQRRFAQVLRQLGLEQDVDGLKQFRSQFTKQFKSTHKKLYKLRKIIVSCIIMDTEDRHSLLSPEDSKFVSNYLFERDIWYTLEYVLYSDCVPFLQPADFEKLYNKFLTIHFSFRQRGDYMDLFFQSFYNTAVALYYRQAYSPAIQTLDRLKEQQIPDSLFSIRLHLRLLRRLCQYKLTNSTETAAELSELVKVISKISPAFGRRWKSEFQFHEPVSDHT